MRYHELISRVQRNPLVASVILVGTIVVALSTFTDAAENLLQLVTGKKAADVTGSWLTDVLSNPFDQSDSYRWLFDLQAVDTTVAGTMTETPTDGGRSVERAIKEATLHDNLISFYIPYTASLHDGTVDFRDHYLGRVTKDTIYFTLRSDRPWGFPTQRFTAVREPRDK
jgi:hypothetical protein